MKKMNIILFSSLVLAVVCVFAVSGPAQAVSFNGNYLETFDSLGTSGIAFHRHRQRLEFYRYVSYSGAD